MIFPGTSKEYIYPVQNLFINIFKYEFKQSLWTLWSIASVIFPKPTSNLGSRKQKTINSTNLS